MALSENVKFELKLEAAMAGKTIGDLTKSMKFLKSELLEADGIKFQKLSKALNEVEGKLGDMNDAARTLTGSGIERLNSSFGLFQEGLTNFDTDKVKAGFKALGTAMDAIPIFLIIEGLKLLWDNFDKVKDIVKSVTGTFSDEEKEIKRLEATKKKLEASNKDLVSSIDAEVTVLTAEIGLMKEQHKSNVEIEKQEERLYQLKIDKLRLSGEELKVNAEIALQKVKEIVNNDDLIESGMRLSLEKAKLMGNDKEAELLQNAIAVSKKQRADAEYKIITDSINSAKQLTAEVKALSIERKTAEVKDANERNEKVKEANEKKLENEKKYWEDWFKITKEEGEKLASELQKQRNADEIEEEKKRNRFLQLEKEKGDLLKTINESIYQKEKTFEQKKLDDFYKRSSLKKDAIEEFYRKELELAGDDKGAIEQAEKNKNEKLKKLKVEQKNEIAEINRQALIKELQEDVAMGQSSAQIAQGFADTIFSIKMANIKKGSKEEENAAREQFKINKALSISTAVMQGAQSVLAITAVPDFTLGIASALRIAGVVATTAATVAKISATQFQATGSAGSSSSSGVGGSSVGQPTPQFQAPTFFGLGQVTGPNDQRVAGPQRVYVTEGDISKVQNRVSVIESRARIV